MQVFLQQGYANNSTDRVAAQAGLAKQLQNLGDFLNWRNSAPAR
jgi:hypothetical protein